jgi:hypothetical protein
MRELSIEEVDQINGAGAGGAAIEGVIGGAAGEFYDPYAGAAVEVAVNLDARPPGSTFKIYSM